MRILVIGASGYLGNTIYKKLKECSNDNVLGTYCKSGNQELTYSKFTGIINISGERPVSHYDFNKYLARLMNVDDSFIIPDYRKEEEYNNLNNSKRKLILNTAIQEI